MTPPPSKVLVRSTTILPVADAVREVMEGCGWREIVRPGARVILKPNLCCDDPEKAASANTDPRVLAAVIEVLQERTRDITVGEADGPRHKAEAAFAASGVVDLASRYGVSLLNFTHAPTRPVDHPFLAEFALPEALLAADVFITLPVVKTHALTVFTGALKNQWGCVPRADRIIWHRYLDRLLVDLQGLLRPHLAIMDGIIGMEGRGPANGKPRRLDVVLGSTDMVALDATAMRLIGLAPRACAHLVGAHEAGHGQLEPGDIAIDGDFEAHFTTFEPARLDWAIAATNYMTRFPLFTYRVLLNDTIFYPTKRVVQWLRAVGVV